MSGTDFNGSGMGVEEASMIQDSLNDIQQTMGGEDLVSNDDDVIPTAIVIKNIPFAIKKEQLLDVIANLDLPLPYAFNYHLIMVYLEVWLLPISPIRMKLLRC